PLRCARSEPGMPTPDPGAAPRVTRKKAAMGGVWVAAEFGSNQGLRLVRNVFLTHMITQQMYGLLGLAGIVVDFVNNISDVGINMSIIRQRRDDEQRFLDSAWTLSVIRGLLVWLIACAMAFPAALFYDEPALALAVPLLGLSAVMLGACSTKFSTYNRDLEFARVTLIKIVGKVIGFGATIAWALIAPDNLGVILVGPLLAGLLTLIASHMLLAGTNNRFAWDRDAIRELISFGKWVFLATLLTFLIRKGDLLIIGKLEGTEAFAVYAVAYSMANMLPKMCQAISSKVLFPIYSNIQNDEPAELRRKIFKARFWLLRLFLPALWLLIAFGGFVVDLLYPDSYTEAGWMLELLACGACGQIVSMSIGGIVLAKGDGFRYMALRFGTGVTVLSGMVLGLVYGPGFWPEGGQVGGLVIGMGIGYWLNYPVMLWAIRGYGVWLPRLDLICFAASAVVIAVRFGVF
ncbi:MAG: oligosaccharide flippase family protein, partial [Planctomycetota bacterium]